MRARAVFGLVAVVAGAAAFLLLPTADRPAPPAQPPPDRILVDKLPFLFDSPKPGDSIVFEDAQGRQFIKRVATPGDAGRPTAPR